MADATPTTQPAQNASAATTKVERPSREQVEKRAKELDAIIKANVAIMAEAKEKLEKLSKDKQSGGDKRSVEFNKLNELRSESKRLSDERQALYDEQKNLRAQQVKLRTTQDEMKTKLKQNNCFTTAEVDGKIRELEYRLATTALSLKEEKSVIQDIKNLNASKKTIAEYDGLVKRRADLETKLQEVDASIKKSKDAFNDAKTKEKAQSDIVDSLKKPAGKSEAALLVEKRQAAYEEIQKAKKQIQDLWTEFREKQDAFNKAMAAKREEYAEKRKAEIEQRKEEDRIRRLEGEEEKIERLHVEAFASIEQLKFYLKAHLKSQQDDNAKEAPAPLAPQPGEIGKRVKDLDEDMYGTRKPAKKPKARKPQKPRALVFDAQSLREFESLKIEPPLNSEEIPATLEALDKKKQELEADKAAQHKKRLENLAAALESKADKAAEPKASETPASEEPSTPVEAAAVVASNPDDDREAEADEGVMA